MGGCHVDEDFMDLEPRNPENPKPLQALSPKLFGKKLEAGRPCSLDWGSFQGPFNKGAVLLWGPRNGA